MDVWWYSKFFMYKMIGRRFATGHAKAWNQIDFKDWFVILDVDDTLCGDSQLLGKTTLKALGKLAKSNSMALITNNKHPRPEIQKVCASLSIPYIFNANKPNPASLKKVMNKQTTIIVSDRAMDLFAAYKAGVTHRILVAPLSPNTTPWFVAVSRFLENINEK